jgi:hypothetical protein
MKRIQRKRTKGWKMPPNAVYVGRPTKWGNPYKVGVDGDAIECKAKYSELINRNVWSIPNTQDAILELRGKDLACWCALDKPCHADVLLKLANESEEK